MGTTADETTRKRVYGWIDSHFDEFVRDLQDYARVPTISAVRKAESEGAEACRKVLEKRGVKTRRMPVDGGPDIVLGDVAGEPGAPTLILYNHYDVQPVDPLDEWKREPFDPVVEDGKMFARGVADTKGNAVAQAVAQQAVREVCGSLPVNLRFMIEGEEEVGSPNLMKFWRANQDLFRGAGATIEAGGHTIEGKPTLDLGSKGILYVELRSRTADIDQHSSLAASLPNPAWRIISALRVIRSERGEVLVPGFYSGIAKPKKEMLALLRKNEFDPLVYKEIYGAKEVYGGKTRLARLKHAAYSPTCNIDGFYTGYIHEGSKTINPAYALVKLDFRLLPGQRPWKIYESLKRHLKRKGFGDLEVSVHSVFEPGATSPKAAIAQTSIAACREVYGQEPEVFPWIGGSSTTWYYTSLGTPAIHPTGVGYSGSKVHAPNEHIRLEDARRATKAFAAMMMLFPEVLKRTKTRS